MVILRAGDTPKTTNENPRLESNDLMRFCKKSLTILLERDVIPKLPSFA